MTALPMVSVLVPARNEVADIERCLQHIAQQDYPINRIEVLVIDGCSADGTAHVAERALNRYGFGSAAVLSNEGATTPSNLNVGLARTTGEIVCRVDSRTLIEPHHVRRCVNILMERPEVSVVGGAQLAIARHPTAKHVGMARALNNRWSMGFARYRTRVGSGPADTVYLGAFRTAQLHQAGGWDERLPTNQDFDLNRRMGRLGIVWFDSGLPARYIPRASLAELWRQYERFGSSKARYWRITGDRPQPRQMVLLAGPPLVGIVVAMFMTRSGSTGRRLWLGLGVAALGSVEHHGSAEGPPASPAGRGMAVVSICTVASAWLTGAYKELFLGRRR